MTETARTTHTPATGRAAARLTTTRSTAAQWFGVLAGPLAMLTHLQIQYALVPWACYSGARYVLHISPVVLLAVTAVGALVARREWRIAGGGNVDDESGTLARVRLLGVAGMATSTFFAIVIAAMWLADVFLDTCHGS